MAEAHPVGFRWVMKAKERGATIIHVDPRFSRTSALADIWVPIRAGGDIAFLGGLVRHIIENNLFFRDYVVHYTNASCILREDFRDAEEGATGFFSGWNEQRRAYDNKSWGYQGDSGLSFPERDLTLQHPRCAFQSLRRHFARYTPEMVEKICGIPPALFQKVADALVAASGPDKTAAICYALGWTQHSKGVQIIRTASILQLLLGNIGRPGGGILALRGHASIQGSTDIPTLYDILPGYLSMPKGDGTEETLRDYLAHQTKPTGLWNNYPSYFISLMKAYYGKNATAENDFGYNWVPKITGNHSFFEYVSDMADGKMEGMFMMGQNPAVAAGKLPFPAKGTVKIKMAGRARYGRDRSGRILGRFAGDRARGIENGGDRDRSFLFSSGWSRGKGRHIHQHTTAVAVASESGDTSRRLSIRRVVHASAGDAFDRQSERIERSDRRTVARARLVVSGR